MLQACACLQLMCRVKALSPRLYSCQILVQLLMRDLNWNVCLHEAPGISQQLQLWSAAATVFRSRLACGSCRSQCTLVGVHGTMQLAVMNCHIRYNECHTPVCCIRCYQQSCCLSGCFAAWRPVCEQSLNFRFFSVRQPGGLARAFHSGFFATCAYVHHPMDRQLYSSDDDLACCVLYVDQLIFEVDFWMRCMLQLLPCYAGRQCATW